MKGKLVLTLGFAGVLAVSIGFVKDLPKTEASAEVSSKQTDTYKLVTREEQDRREGIVVEGKDITTVITAEEQNMVENSSAQQGFVPQENGTGFYFVKEKK
ncbi:hypothetical protein SOP93_26205 [Peribacillus frigoritolerans]|uniref:hypothetical protein n=1 Tax=Peribacillus frigoritolerans TaxID=450367 RepID=UPI002B24E73E|nr:hypothetical protein [Peribacillus frigoritolerans]MEB2494579.1 hypothetical protein [Peribacillus frigoritolerans]